MPIFETTAVGRILLVAFGITAVWLIVGTFLDFWLVHRLHARKHRWVPRWWHAAAASIFAVVATPRAASASPTPTPTESTADPQNHDQGDRIDPLFAASVAANAGFAAFEVSRQLVRLRRTKFGGSDSQSDIPPENRGTTDEEPLDWRMLVRVLGSPVVESVNGDPVVFEKGKALELVVWMVEHRENSTRSAARTALWDGNVKDSTFSNVVSEARRALQSVDPLIEEEWIPRTFSDELPLHSTVVSDSQLLERALERFIVDPVKHRQGLITELSAVRNLPFSGANYGWADGEGITTSHVIRVVKAAVLLAEHAIECDDNGLLFMATERGLRVLPGHEELVSLRMKGHARSGNRSAIKFEWESYARAIEADSWAGAEPSPDLERLARELSSK